MDKIITLYQKLFKEYIQANPGSALGVIKKVYRGDPYQYPSDSMPCITIEPLRSEYVPYLQYDRRNHPLELTVIMSVKDIFGSLDDDEVTFKKVLVDIVEGTTLNGSDIREDTVIGLIQKNPCLHYEYDADPVNPGIQLINETIVNEIQNVNVTYQKVQGTKGDILYKAVVRWTALSTGIR